MTAPLLGLAVAALLVLGGRPRTTRSGPLRRRASDLDWSARVVERLDRVWPGRRDRRRDRQLPNALDRLGAALRSGQAMGPALVALAGDVPDPLGHELRGVARALDHGGAVAAALASWSASDRSSRDVRLVAAALTVGAGTGGEVARAVDGVAATLRERHEVAAEARALATQARTSAMLLVIAPVAFAGLVATVEPAAIGFLLATPVGLGCVFLGIGLDVVGAVWMARITGGGK